MSYFIWFGFLAVAVNDARENRIPNLFLLLILAFCIAEKALSSAPIEHLLWSSVAGACMFAGALIFHLLRVMAPGDVKLLGVVGFWLGWGHLISATLWIALASVVIGVLYAVINRAEDGSSIKQLVSKYSMMAAYGVNSHTAISSSAVIERKLRMPFAPVVVIGLAMYHYF